ncbi:MAG: DNA repair protein RecN [Porticoccaceae bacterium]
MLTSLDITNYALAAHLEVEFGPGMTAITGETGAGKSLVVDALGMALGDRGETDRIRAGAERCEVAARFLVADNAAANAWLEAQDYPVEPECLLRRVFTRDGRSRGYINGRTATMQQLQELGELLIDIHSQHEHQSLLRRETHGRLIDAFGVHGELLARVSAAATAWRQCSERLRALEGDREQLGARRELLAFQVAELDRLAPLPGELDALERDHKLLGNAEQILASCRTLLALGGDGDEGTDLGALLARARHLAADLAAAGASLDGCVELFDSARIQVEEALREVAATAAGVEADPQRLQTLEARLDAYYRLARRHQVPPAELAELHQHLRAELDGLGNPGQDLDALRKEQARCAAIYQAAATALTGARRQAAAQFAAAVNARLAALGLGAARLEVALQPRPAGECHPAGAETPELLISSNPGQPPRPLAKIASGGELSRISLAIQVIAAEQTRVPAMVFDEVDVGIGGATAATVGQLLRRLGSRGQVIAITHLPQVASHAHRHLVVTKTSADGDTTTALQPLAAAERVAEIARMLGGARVTAKTSAHARELLALGSVE